MTVKKILTTLGLSTAAVLTSFAVASPALAYDDYISTDDSDPGGRVYWTANGDVVRVCDIEADGYAVLARVGYNVGQYEVDHIYTVRAGGNGNCNQHDAGDGGVYDLRENRSIHVTVCLYSSDHPGTYCDWTDWTS